MTLCFPVENAPRLMHHNTAPLGLAQKTEKRDGDERRDGDSKTVLAGKTW